MRNLLEADRRNQCVQITWNESDPSGGLPEVLRITEFGPIGPIDGGRDIDVSGRGEPQHRGDHPISGGRSPANLLDLCDGKRRAETISGFDDNFEASH